jgi:hypothetical protein
MDLLLVTSLFFSATAQVRPCPHIVGRNQYGAEFGLGPLTNGLTYYPVQYSSFQFASHSTVVTVAMPAAAVVVAAVAEARAQAGINFLEKVTIGNLNSSTMATSTVA